MAIRFANRVRVAALILGGVGLTLAAQPARANTQISYTQAEPPSEALARHMRELARDQRDFKALIGAGKAALALGDTQSAAGFFGRAEEAWPASPMPQIGIGAALAHEGEAAAALQYFARAAQLGAAVQSFAVERGLAFDLLGRHAEAQSDYRVALGTVDADEARRRLALSLAITGNKAEAISILGPLMARGDAAGARCRAFVLALTGDQAGARAMIDARMPGVSAQLAYFFSRLPTLRSDEKAAAVHLGLFPHANGTGVAVASSTVSGDRLQSIEEMLAASSQPSVRAVAEVPAAPVYPNVQRQRIAAPTQVASNSATRRTTTSARVTNHRYWVQLASGKNETALPDQFRKMKRRFPDLLEDLAGYVARDSDRSRLLIGPFADEKAATEFANGLDSSGLDAFGWTLSNGAQVRKLSTE